MPRPARRVRLGTPFPEPASGMMMSIVRAFRRYVFWVAVLSIFSGLTPCLFAARQARIVRHPGRTHELLQRLNRLLDHLAKFSATREADDLPYNVPAVVRPQLTDVKHLLLQLIQMDLAQGHEPDTLLKHLRMQIARASAGIAEPKCGLHGFCSYYGRLVTLRVERPREHPDLLAVITGLDLFCGQDESLYLFRRRNSGVWRLLLADEVNGFKAVSHARENLKFAISPPVRPHHWFLVITATPPWCTSVWSALNAWVFVPDPGRSRLKLVEHRRIGINRDYGYVLKVAPGGFALGYLTTAALDFSDLFVRPGLAVYKRKCSHDKLRCSLLRLPYFSNNPIGFLSAWADRKWSQVHSWNGSVAGLRSAHKKILQLGAMDTMESSLKHYRACKLSGIASPQWQVQLRFINLHDVLVWQRYFSIRQIGVDQFAIDGISKNSFPGCAQGVRVTMASKPSLPTLDSVMQAAGLDH